MSDSEKNTASQLSTFSTKGNQERAGDNASIEATKSAQVAQCKELTKPGNDSPLPFNREQAEQVLRAYYFTGLSSNSEPLKALANHLSSALSEIDRLRSVRLCAYCEQLRDQG